MGLADSRHRSLNFLILIAILIIDLTSFTCILPLFPSILDFYSQNAVRLAQNNSTENRDLYWEYWETGMKYFQSVIGVPDFERYNNVFFGGILGSVFSLLQYLSSPMLGALSDIYGRKPILLLSVCGSLASYYLWSIADTFGVFILSRIIGGLSKASVSIAIAIVTDIFPAKLRGKGMAFVGVSFSVAFILGPMIGAYFASKAKQAIIGTEFCSGPARFALYSTIFELVLIFFALSETLTNPSLKLIEVLSSVQNYVLPSRLFKFSALTNGNNVLKTNESAYKTSKKMKSLRRLCGYGQLYFVFLFLYSALEFTLCFLTHIRFNYDGMQQGRLYFFSGILMILVQGGYVRRIPIEKQERGVLLGLSAIIPAYLLISVAFDQLILYAGLLLYSYSSALVVPCLTTLMSRYCEESKKGSCMGVFRSIGALARACGPIFGSFLFWLLGPMYSYMVGAILLIIPVIQLRLMKELNNEQNSQVAITKELKSH